MRQPTFQNITSSTASQVLQEMGAGNVDFSIHGREGPTNKRSKDDKEKNLFFLGCLEFFIAFWKEGSSQVFMIINFV